MENSRKHIIWDHLGVSENGDTPHLKNFVMEKMTFQAWP
jgi:hypothetical protein